METVQTNTETAPVETQQTIETKPTEEQQPTQEVVVPEKYDLKLDDGAVLDSAYLEQFSQFAKEKKFTQEQAQEFLSRENALLSGFVQKQQQEFEAMQKAWVDEVKKDSEIGGEKFNESVELAHRALKQFGSEKFLNELESTGYGNHPELVRVFAKIGQLLKDDKMVSPNSNNGGTKSLEEIFYGKQ